VTAEHGWAGPWEWAVAGQALAGQDECGDCWVVVDGAATALFAVIDGLGHGPEAAHAARLAARVITDNPSEPLDALLVLCHQALMSSRGAAITVGSVDHESRELRWLGVGNVDGTLLRPTPGSAHGVGTPLLRGGIVGYQLPQLRLPEVLSVRIGDVMIMATDGVSSNFADGLSLAISVEELAKAILTKRMTGNDDAFVLVTRYRGSR
jgi:phosphoserine phosphatase RsbX